MRRLVALGRTLSAILRALADEDAYARHVAQHGTVRAKDDWRRFIEERFRAKYGSGRCC